MRSCGQTRRLAYQQFGNLIGNVTDMIVAGQSWQPMIDAIWENRAVEDYETTGSTVKTDFMRKWHHNREQEIADKVGYKTRQRSS